MSKIRILIFLFFLSLFILSSGGHFYTRDGLIMYKVAESIVEKGSFRVDGISPIGLAEGSDNHFYSPYGLGMSLVYIPFYAAGKSLASFLSAPEITVMTTCFANSFVSAVSMVVFFSLALFLGFSRKK